MSNQVEFEHDASNIASRRRRQLTRFPLLIGWHDVRQYYRRTVIGPFWFSLGMSVQVAAMALVFSFLFKIEIREYLPLLTTGLVLWNFLAASLVEGTTSVSSNDYIIKQIAVPVMSYPLRTLWKNAIIFAHNAVVIPIVFIACGVQFSADSLWAIPGFLLFVINLGWMITILGILGARYRDLTPMVSAALAVLIYVTPVMWQPTAIPEAYRPLLLDSNPFYHLIQVVRQPLLYGQFESSNFVFALLLATAGIGIAALTIRLTQNRIAYWV